MKVVCIDNIFRGERIPFTIGGVYETSGGKLEHLRNTYSVISDDGLLYNLSTSRFIKLGEWREIKIDKILSE